MPTADATREQQGDPTDLSVDLFRYIERKLRALRGVILQRAGEIAAEESRGPIHRVTKEYVDHALREILADRRDIGRIEYLLGLTRQPPEALSKTPPVEQREKRAEDLSFSVFRYVERKLRLLRGVVLQTAAQFPIQGEEATTESGEKAICRVSESRIDRALKEILDAPNGTLEMLGV